MATVGLASSARATGDDGEERAEIVSEISTDEQCAEWKAQFASKYEVYRSLVLARPDSNDAYPYQRTYPITCPVPYPPPTLLPSRIRS